MNDSVIDEGRRFTQSPLVKRHTLGMSFLLVVLLLIGSLLYSTLSWMWDDQRLPLSRIVIEGELQYVQPLDVQRALAQLEHVGTFMSQDIKDVQNAVEQIPWVSHAAIRKQWPETIKIFLTEYHAEAIWNGQWLLNEQGVVFNGDIGQLTEERVKLYGPKNSSEEVLAQWRDLSKKLKPLELEISSLVLNERRAWQIILANGIRLELGKGAIEERTKRFITLYQKLGNKTQKISYIDLRYDTGAAVGWFPEEELEQEIADD
ncbi:cell division protein FtsQ/DivIB [Vibrio sonorensis]|uniref:cell division protein FtsQ/DivIB n=1 Tax=Vibrio sonorensis TaxID=1004316 RepID=UPI0008DA5AB7|nr:cell division protein FtsQ/DivIB [Vibrio sonorensis]